MGALRSGDIYSNLWAEYCAEYGQPSEMSFGSSHFKSAGTGGRLPIEHAGPREMRSSDCGRELGATGTNRLMTLLMGGYKILFVRPVV